MIEKSGKEIRDKKPYVSVCVETILLEKNDVITTSNSDNDFTQSDIF